MHGEFLEEEWHNQILEEEYPTIIECLEKVAKVFAIRKTEIGYKFIELCDQYYGVTLSQQQLERLAEELRQMAKAS